MRSVKRFHFLISSENPTLKLGILSQTVRFCYIRTRAVHSVFQGFIGTPMSVLPATLVAIVATALLLLDAHFAEQDIWQPDLDQPFHVK